MRGYHLLIAVLISTITACKKDMGKPNQPAESTQLRDISTPPPLCYGNHWEYASTYPTRGLGLVHNDKLYVPDYFNQLVKIYDGTGWTSIASAVPISTMGNPFFNLYSMVAFTIGNKGYIMKPHDPDGGFWEYNFAQNTWKRKADFPAFARYDPACFSIGTKGYVVGGWKDLDTYLSETWQYNQSTDNWSQKAGIGNPGKAYVTGFSINNKGYIVCGRVLTNGNETYTKKLMQYDPSTDNWTTREPFPGDAREYPSVFVIDDKAYVGGGGKDLFNTVFEDFYRYNPATDSWSTIAGLPGVFQMFTFFGFSLNSLGYCVTEFNDNLSIYKYTPLVCP